MFEIFERIMPDAEGRAEYHYVLMDYLCRVVGGQLAAVERREPGGLGGGTGPGRISSYRRDLGGDRESLCKTSALICSNSNRCASWRAGLCAADWARHEMEQLAPHSDRDVLQSTFADVAEAIDISARDRKNRNRPPGARPFASVLIPSLTYQPRLHAAY